MQDWMQEAMPGLYHDSVDCVKKQLVQPVFFQKMPKFAQRCFIRNRFGHKINASEFPHGIAVIILLPDGNTD